MFTEIWGWEVSADVDLRLTFFGGVILIVDGENDVVTLQAPSLKSPRGLHPVLGAMLGKCRFASRRRMRCWTGSLVM